MSNYVRELLKDISSNPETFKDYFGNGIEKDNIRITGFGNTRLLSCITVRINNKDIPTSYIDKWRLETAIKKWYRTVSLKTLLV
jgi:hypothetical protein